VGSDGDLAVRLEDVEGGEGALVDISDEVLNGSGDRLAVRAGEGVMVSREGADPLCSLILLKLAAVLSLESGRPATADNRAIVSPICL